MEDAPARPAASALTRYSAISDGCAAAALTARPPLVSASSTDATRRMRRRSKASPSEPPMSAPAISGSSWARLTSPTWSEDWVSAYTWNGMATAMSWLPNTSTNSPANSRRKPRDSRNGPRSMKIRFGTGTIMPGQ